MSMEYVLVPVLVIVSILLAISWEKVNIRKRHSKKLSFLIDRGPLLLSLVVSAILLLRFDLVFDNNEILGYLYLGGFLVTIFGINFGTIQLNKKTSGW